MTPRPVPVVARATALAAALLGAALLPAAAQAAAPEKPYIVLYKPSTTKAQTDAVTDRIERQEDVDATHRFENTVRGFSAELGAADVREIRDDPRVQAVVPDRPVKATGLVNLAPGDTIPTGVRRAGAAVDTRVREASMVNVAVVDTGIDLTHPDLNAVAGKTCVGTSAADQNGHGTHVAGTIGARNNGNGAVGVAPGTRLVAVRVLDANGSGLWSSIICGIDWVTSTRTDADPTNDIGVANMSLGGTGAPTSDCGRASGEALHMAICRSVAAGVTYVVAAGNNATDEQTFVPASYPEVLTVTSVADSDGLPGARGGQLGCRPEGDDTPAAYSNFATRAEDVAHTIAAPGSCIRSTWLGGQYATISGTSMAAPHVTGLVALCAGDGGVRGPCWGKSPDEVRALMLRTAAARSAAAPGDGFAGDPTRPVAGRTYGYLATPPAAAVAPPVAAPVNTVRPAIAGVPVAGNALTAATSTWTGAQPIAQATQWLRCPTTATTGCLDIAAATTSRYALTGDDVGKVLRVRVVAKNAGGSTTALSDPTAVVTAAPAPPVSTGVPTVTGSALVGSPMLSSAGTWSGTNPISTSVQWLRCTATCADIRGAVGSTYVPTKDDVGRSLRTRVTATNARGTASALSAATPLVAVAGSTGPPRPTGPPLITGTPAAGQLLTASPGPWTGQNPMTLTIWWATCGPGSSTCFYNGASGTTYRPPSGAPGTRWVVVVEARNALGVAYSQSPPTAPAATGARVASAPAGTVLVSGLPLRR